MYLHRNLVRGLEVSCETILDILSRELLVFAIERMWVLGNAALVPPLNVPQVLYSTTHCSMEKPANLLGCYAPDFELPGTDGAVHHLARYLERFHAVCVVFLANQCPTVQGYIPRLKQLQTDFAPQGFTLVGINANDPNQSVGDDLEGMKQFVAHTQLNFPYLRDVTQDVGRSFGAMVTPEVFLLNQQGIVCYSGGIDDAPEDASAVQVAYLRQAVQQVLQGEPIVTPWVMATGSAITWHP